MRFFFRSNKETPYFLRPKNISKPIFDLKVVYPAVHA